MLSVTASMIFNPRPRSAVSGTGSLGGGIIAAPLPVLTTSITHRSSLARAITSYWSAAPACSTTLAHASVRASAMSVRVSAVTPRVSRQPSRTWRLIGTLAASRGKNSTTLNSTSSTSQPGLAVVVRLATFPARWHPNARPGRTRPGGASCQLAGGGEDKTVAEHIQPPLGERESSRDSGATAEVHHPRPRRKQGCEFGDPVPVAAGSSSVDG